MDSVLFEPLLLEQYVSEYLKLINIYANVTRPSVFIDYYRINKDKSIFNKDTSSTYGRFNAPNGIVYDLYSLTPAFYTSQSVNDIVDDDLGAGPILSSNISITVYTLDFPNVDDIVYFSRAPFNTSFEFWRVTSFRSAVNAMKSHVNFKWFELMLEYAPIKSLDVLNVSDRYVYLLTEEKYVPIDTYNRFLKITDKISSIFKEMVSKYDKYLELYGYNNEFPIEPNYEIYKFFASTSNYSRYFNDYPVPYGVLNYPNQNALSVYYIMKNKYITSTRPTENRFDTSNINNILTYNGEINVYVLAKILNLYQREINELRRS